MCRIMGKEMEKKMNNDMETELIWWIIGVWVPTSTTSSAPVLNIRGLLGDLFLGEP